MGFILALSGYILKSGFVTVTEQPEYRITLPSFYWLKLIWVGVFTRTYLLSKIYLIVPRPSNFC